MEITRQRALHLKQFVQKLRCCHHSLGVITKSATCQIHEPSDVQQISEPSFDAEQCTAQQVFFSQGSDGQLTTATAQTDSIIAPSTHLHMDSKRVQPLLGPEKKACTCGLSRTSATRTSGNQSQHPGARWESSTWRATPHQWNGQQNV